MNFSMMLPCYGWGAVKVKVLVLLRAMRGRIRWLGIRTLLPGAHVAALSDLRLDSIVEASKR